MRSFALRILSALFLSTLAGAAFAQAQIADAASQGNKAEIERLLKRGGDVNAQQATGATALQWAAYRVMQNWPNLLLKAGAKPGLANRDGATPLWLAAARGDAAVIQALLKGGADANEQLPLGRRPLMLAARSGNVDAVRALLEHGADVNASETERGTSALMQAAGPGPCRRVEGTDPARRQRGGCVQTGAARWTHGSIGQFRGSPPRRTSAGHRGCYARRKHLICNR